ncbi:type II toxin-antitoxin system RelE/ParE family toxin [Candidatus Acetothermia bacterium]|nr:type II toxin-antitoxin system RelE/ParE family toxin [Candidatus Acetothermia bacterium]
MKAGKAWELRYDPRVRSALEKLRDRAVLRRLEKAALRLKDRPERGKRLKGYENRGLRSYRVGTPGGEYRILYQLILKIIDDDV